MKLVLVELRDREGFVFGDDDLVSAVLTTGSYLYLIDEDTWRGEVSKDIIYNTRWLSVDRLNYLDDGVRYATFGKTKNGLFYARCSSSSATCALVLVDPGDIIRYQKETLFLDYKNENFAAQVGLGVEGKERFIFARVTTGSDNGAWMIKKQYLNGLIKKGEIVEITPPDLELKTVACKFADTHTGDWALNLVAPAKQKIHEANGNSAIEVKVVADTNGVYFTSVCHGRQQKDGRTMSLTFDALNISCQNTSNEKLSAEVTAEYEDSAGRWNKAQAFTGTSFPTRSGYQGQFSQQNLVNIEGNTVQPLALRAVLPNIVGKFGRGFNDRARSPKSLPQPLRVRFSLLDVHGKRKSLIVEQVNKALSVKTVVSYKEGLSKNYIFVAFAYADNTETEERSHAYMYVDVSSKEKRCVVGRSGTYQYYNHKDFRKMTYKAMKGQFEEKQIDYLTTDKIQFVGLYHKASNYQIYAIRVIIKTETGSSTNHFTIPYSLFD